MLHPNELRQGNWICAKDNDRSRYFQCTYLHIELLTKETVHDLHPIPLSTTILKKSGFVWSFELLKWTKKIDERNIYQLGEDAFGLFCSNVFGLRITYLKYLHVLQNHYYALIGEELKVNL